MKKLVKLLTTDKQARLYLTDATEVLRQSGWEEIKTPDAQELYRTMFTICCLLRGLLTQEEQRISIHLRFRKKGHSLQCEVDGTGNIHCLFSASLKVFEGRITDLVGEGATLSLTRGSWKGGMFTGTVEAKAGTLEDCFADFYSQSEQTETIFLIGEDKETARGCMIQPLPFASHGRTAELVHQWTATKERCQAPWRNLAATVFPNTRLLEEYELETHCACSREMFFGLLLSLETEELQAALEAGKTEELECGICGKAYRFSPEELEMAVSVKERSQYDSIPEDRRGSPDDRANDPDPALL